MKRELAHEELEALLDAPAEQRLEYFLERVVESGVLWTLAQDESLLVLGTEEHESIVPLFSHPDFALAWFEDSGLEEADLVGMELSSWIGGTLQELSDSSVEIAVFPTPSEEAIYEEPLQLLRQLRAEVEQMPMAE